jgi:hypothetical protein
LPVTPAGTTARTARKPLVREQPDLITNDPITGVAIRCADLRDTAERCYAEAYASGNPRGRLAICRVRAMHAVRTCGLGVSITGRRNR